MTDGVVIVTHTEVRVMDVEVEVVVQDCELVELSSDESQDVNAGYYLC